MIQKATRGQLVNGSFIMKTHPLMHYVSCRVFWWNIKSPRWLSPATAQIWDHWLLSFSKTKIFLEREEISNHQWDSGKYDRTADGEWENSVRSQGVYFEGDWGVIVLCTMFLASSSINVYIFHTTWLDIFWTDYIYIYNLTDSSVVMARRKREQWLCGCRQRAGKWGHQ